MIDPFNVTNYKRTLPEAEEFLLFCTAVAGKQASGTAKRLERFLNRAEGTTPFDKIRNLISKKRLEMEMRNCSFGQYSKLVKAYTQLVESNINLLTCTSDDLEQIHGIGPKTARYFILHSRPNANVACLDVHLLRYLKSLGHRVPKATPTGSRYKKIERIYLQHAKELGKDPAELDLEIWSKLTRSLPQNIKQGE
jgi:thermostable 8-oxoguanine DNA glycosylase